MRKREIESERERERECERKREEREKERERERERGWKIVLHCRVYNRRKTASTFSGKLFRTEKD